MADIQSVREVVGEDITGRVVPYLVGLCSASVCVASDVDADELERAMNMLHPTGISSPWKVADDETFANGSPNPCSCEQDASRTHYLLHC